MKKLRIVVIPALAVLLYMYAACTLSHASVSEILDSVDSVKLIRSESRAGISYRSEIVLDDRESVENIVNTLEESRWFLPSLIHFSAKSTGYTYYQYIEFDSAGQLTGLFLDWPYMEVIHTGNAAGEDIVSTGSTGGIVLRKDQMRIRFSGDKHPELVNLLIELQGLLDADKSSE